MDMHLRSSGFARRFQAFRFLASRRGIVLAAVLMTAPFAWAALVSASWLGRPAVAVTSVFPLQSASATSPHSRIQLSFNLPLSAAMAETLAIRVTAPDARVVGGHITFYEDRTAAVFKPSAPLPEGEFDVVVRLGADVLKHWTFSVPDKRDIEYGTGGPILLVTDRANPFAPFYGEILRAEGYSAFTRMYVADLTPERLAAHEVAIVAAAVEDPNTFALIEKWVNDGGKLVLVRPTGPLAALAGFRQMSSVLSDAYFSMDQTSLPGRGLVSETIQFHGLSDVVTPDAETRTLASLHRTAAEPPLAPALTLRKMGGNGGEVAAFTFDLAQSVVLTRQGNIEWAGVERDGFDPIRPNDLFFGAAANDPQPDYLDLDKVAVPQADEAMRLLSNLIVHLTRDAMPVPRFWYFPNQAKAVLVMAADDHGSGEGTQRSLDYMLDTSAPDCVVDNWECGRATSWMYVTNKVRSKNIATYAAAGFDIGLHPSTYCKNWSEESLSQTFATGLFKFRNKYPDLLPQRGNRLHCIAWSDYVSQPRIGRGWGIRYDMNYYYWPKNWIRGRSGFMTGSGIPMRFSDAAGELLNVYQQETHLVDEVFTDNREAVERLIDRALGPEGYYGAFGTHYDFHSDFDRTLMDIARSRNVPMVSAAQMLDWMDGRGASSAIPVSWSDGRLTFKVDLDQRVGRMLRVMVPARSGERRLSEVVGVNGAVDVSVTTLKGVDYAILEASSGTFEAIYR